MPEYLSQTDLDTYGADLVNLALRAGAHAVSPQLEQLARQSYELQQQLAEERRHRINRALDSAVSDWRAINADSGFHAWLRGRHDLSGQSRQSLLDAASARGDATAVVRVFRSYLREASGEQYHAERAHAPGARSSRSSGGPIYSREQIKRLYEQHRKGQITGERWAQVEESIAAAAREGRVRDAMDVFGK